MDLVFLGSGEFGVPTLARLAKEHSVKTIVTQPDKPAGRGSQLTPTPVAQWAAEHVPDVPVLKPPKVNAADVVAEIRGREPRAMVVIAFGQKIGRPLLEDVFAVNLHASLLPRWRGAAPINVAVLAGDTETGNSVISLADRMDAGLVYAQSRRPIYPDLTAGELHDLLAEDGPALVEQVLSEFAVGRLRPVEQDESLVTLAPKLGKADGWVDFAGTAEQCRRRVHGLTPWPGVTASLDGKPLKLARVQAAGRAAEEQPGRMIDPEQGLIA
jgi:methionyl-tRNA formyltransferase